MRGQTRLILDKVETEYIRSQIDSGDNGRIKGALQALSKSYRTGITIHPSQLIGVVNSVTATAFRPTIDEKVRRWVLNTLARVGNEGACVPAVQHLIRNHPEEPQTIASGIAAVYKLCTRSSPESALSGINFDPQMRTLAALQHVPASKLDLKDLPLDVERASPDLLKLALLVVGLDRSPDNLLNPRHSDSDMIKALGKHHDPIVSQYSVWAITENDKLRLAHLGLDLKNVESYPENIRSWLFQLLASEATDKEPYWEYLCLGISDPSAEVRKGLAIGLKDVFVDIFEPLVLEWIVTENDAEVRQHLMSHIVKQAERSSIYERYAIEIFDGEPTGSALRQSMEANAVRMPIYIKLKQIGAGVPDLFQGSAIVVEKQYNIGSVNAGAVGFDGSKAINTCATNVQTLSQQKIEAVQSELAQLEAALHGETALPEGAKHEALTVVTAAKADPSPSKIGKVVEFIGHLGTLAEAGTALAPYAVALAAALSG